MAKLKFRETKVIPYCEFNSMPNEKKLYDPVGRYFGEAIRYSSRKPVIK